jgi:hypothetical protein
MARFTQMHAVYDAGTLNLLQRAYDDFCRDAGIEPRPSDAAQRQPALGNERLRTQRAQGHRLDPARPPFLGRVSTSSPPSARAL